MHLKKWFSGIFALALVALLTGCGNNPSASNNTNPQSNSVFVTGTDAPLPSVVGFRVDITGMTLSDGTNPPVSVLNGTQTVDFARLNGMRTLLDINTIPTGTYTQAVITLANPSIDYLNVANPQTNPPTHPTISTLDTSVASNPQLSLTQSTVTINLATPLVVSMGDIDGLRFEFNILKSVAVDGNGQISGPITPTINLKVITPSDADAYIDEFDAGVVSVDAAGNSFVIQGPHGHQFTVNVNQQTEWENNESINNLTSSSIVEISGTLDRTTAAFLADTVAIVSQDKFWAGGLVTYVNPPTGTATDFDMYVRNVLPSGTGFNSGQISNVILSGQEKYFIHWWHDNFGSFLFTSAGMVPGQHISIAGPFSNGQVTVKRIVLRHSGHTGTLVIGQTNTTAGTFEFNSNGLAGVLFEGPVTVQVTPFTRYLGGLTGLNDLTGNTALNLRVVGLILKTNTGTPIYLAYCVEELTN
ncbi:MAG TPA: DUF4382 domain-containing protein [Candidatus Acidoferrum sp.]|nr:DUF4382 domain-containing protein [Candidatus Acidoferrum sp.]